MAKENLNPCAHHLKTAALRPGETVLLKLCWGREAAVQSHTGHQGGWKEKISGVAAPGERHSGCPNPPGQSESLTGLCGCCLHRGDMKNMNLFISAGLR